MGMKNDFDHEKGKKILSLFQRMVTSLCKKPKKRLKLLQPADSFIPAVLRPDSIYSFLEIHAHGILRWALGIWR